MRPPRPRGKRYLAGSALINAEPQQPPSLPVRQLQPTAGSVAAARRRLLPISGNVAPQDKVQRSARERLGYSRANIAAMLRADGVSAALEPWQVKAYLRLADRNTTLAEIGKQFNGDEICASVMVNDWERSIILKYQFTFGRLPAPSAKSEQEPNETDFDRIADGDAAAQDADLAGERMVSVTGQGYSQDTEGRLHDRPLADFDFKQEPFRISRPETVDTLDGPNRDDGERDGLSKDGPDHDDYSDESGA